MSEKESAKLELSNKVAVEETEAPQEVEQKESTLPEHLVKLADAKVPTSTDLVILFPGIEGDLSLMDTIANNLDAEVWGAQYREEQQYISVEESASKLLPVTFSNTVRNPNLCTVCF